MERVLTPSVRRATLSGLLLCIVTATESGKASAQPGDRIDSPRWHFFTNLGVGDTRGEFGSSLYRARTGEFGILRSAGGWRYGLGLSFGSFQMRPPYDHELEWGVQRVFVSGTRMLRTDGSFHPYLQGRLGVTRLHPRSELFTRDPLPADFTIGDSPTKASNGLHVSFVPGVEWQVSSTMALDLSLLFDYYRVGDTDLSPIGQENASSGIDWQTRLGVLWRASSDSAPMPSEIDAWGVRRSYGWAVGEALAINTVASATNEYVRNANFNQISPRSWWSNLKEGFTYDDNDFTTNQFIHPFNGSQYYNSARANGVSFWPSTAIALLGAWHWELAGETHPMSVNDLVSTTVGGIALGETQYRFSSMMLDNVARGSRRFFREAASFVVDPVRGFNRVLSSRSWRVHPNPQDPLDANPPGQHNRMSFGWRRVGDRSTLAHDAGDFGFLRYQHEHGNVFDNSRREAFDYFTMDGDINTGDKSPIGRLMLRGNWWTAPVGEYDRPKHMAAIVQHFEYVNNNAYEYGGQSMGPSFFSRWGSVGSFSFESRVDLLATILGAVNSNYSAGGNVADRERDREYDYGPGGGGRASLEIAYRGKELFSAGYGLQFLQVTNGSLFQFENVDVDARHWLHGANLSLETPTFQGLGLGVEYTTFTRESHYKISIPEISDEGISISQIVKQSNPELRVFFTYFPSLY